MNTELIGTPVAIIKKEGERRSPVVSVSDSNVVQRPFRNLKLGAEDGKFQIIPNPEIERQILYVTGPSGSGKSYFTRAYVEEFQKFFPKRPIILFSSITDDSSIDAIKGLKRVQLTPEFLDEEFEIEDFRDCLAVFDDTDCISDKKMKLKINGILNKILETGRHTNTYCIFTSHLPTAGNDTKRILNESHSITFFPQALGGRSLKYLLESYLGLDNKQIQKVKKLKSRWVTITKSYPKVIVSEKEIFTINTDEDDHHQAHRNQVPVEAVPVPSTIETTFHSKSPEAEPKKSRRKASKDMKSV